MHELLLFGQIPSSRHNQVLNILAGVAAMQPEPVLEKHLVFKPDRPPGTAKPVHVGAAQDVQKSQVQALQAQTQGDLFYLQLVADIHGRDSKPENEAPIDSTIESTTEEEDLQNAAPATQQHDHPNSSTQEEYTLQFRDLPEPARQRPVTSRLIADTPITSGDPLVFMRALDYTLTSTYLTAGHRLTHNSTSLFLYRPLLLPSSASPSSKPHPTTNATLLDPSGSYILQAAIRAADGSKVETMTKGVSELLALKETLRGVVEMEAGERLALDTRVR